MEVLITIYSIDRGDFLWERWEQLRADGLSRAQAADRAGVTEGYLCHLLAGNVQLPRPDVFWGLVDGWKLNPWSSSSPPST